MGARYYQREAIDAVITAWDFDKSVLLRLGTGAGKTYTAAGIIDHVHPSRSLFLADQEELCLQPLESIQRFTGHIAALEKAKYHASLEAKIVVGSSQTLSKAKRLERYPREHFQYIITDEAHRGSDRDKKVHDHFSDAKICGMTATPFRSTLSDLSKWYDRVAYSKAMPDLIGEGFAPPIELFSCPIEINLDHIRMSMAGGEKDYNVNDVETTIEPHLYEIAEMLKENAAGRFGIAYLPLVRSSIAFTNILRKVGISAMHVDATTENRSAIIEAFKHKRFQWLCNADLMSVGVDVPTADAMLNLCPTKSRARYQQRAGRVLRVLPGLIDDLTEKDQAAERRARIAASAKPNALIFDLLWQEEKLGVQGAESVISESAEESEFLRKEARKAMGPIDLIELQKRTQAQREAQLVRALERAAAKQEAKRPVTSDHVAALFGAHDLVGYEPMGRSEMVPATENQIAMIARNGIDPSSIKSRTHASRIIEWILHRSKHSMATIKQLRLISRINEGRDDGDKIKTPELLSMDDASAIIETEFQRRDAERLVKAMRS